MEISVVGPCGSGKSTLINGLKMRGYQANHVAQEHSYVPNMWLRLTHPDFLIYLDASYEICTDRKRLNWTRKEYVEQFHRLEHARAHSDLYIFTDHLSQQEILNHVIDQLRIGQ